MSKKSKRSTARRVLTLEEIDRYRQMIGRLARGRIDQIIPNGHPAHAAVLVEAMFDSAQRDVRIFTGSLAPEAYDQPYLVSAAKRFLEKPATRLRILIQKPLSRQALEQRLFFSELQDTKKVEIRTATGSYSLDDANHFAVMDECGFRYELQHEATQAIANFRAPGIAGQLVTVFDSAFAMGRPVA